MTGYCRFLLCVHCTLIENEAIVSVCLSCLVFLSHLLVTAVSMDRNLLGVNCAGDLVFVSACPSETSEEVLRLSATDRGFHGAATGL